MVTSPLRSPLHSPVRDRISEVPLYYNKYSTGFTMCQHVFSKALRDKLDVYIVSQYRRTDRVFISIRRECVLRDSRVKMVDFAFTKLSTMILHKFYLL